MIKREFKVNFKSFILWSVILVGLFLAVFLIYPYFITDEAVENLDDMMKAFPPELLKVFNMDISSLNTAYGWLKSEGLMFLLIIIGVYVSLLGSNILLKEESDKTIEYLGYLPITRSKIITNKIIVGFTYVFSIILLIGLFNYFALLISGDFDQTQYLLLGISPLLIAFPLFSINLFISTFFHKTRSVLGISLGIVFLSYVLNVLGELSEKVEFIKYFSIYTLADSRNIITNSSLSIGCVIVSIVLTILFVIGTYIRYNKKEMI